MAKQWIFVAVGFWILISPWLLGFAEISIAKWSNVIFGLILIVTSSGIIFAEKYPEKSEIKKEERSHH